jgi:phosphohistidine phosphatase
MHQLHLLRHAKSSWDDDADDHERPLNKRGRDAARLVADALPKAIGGLDLVLCSSALRTRETAELALAGFGKTLPVLYEDGLYLASRTKLMQRVRRLDERAASVMVIGHNPGLHELALALAAPGSTDAQALADGKFPTGVRVSFAIDTPWCEIDGSRHQVIGYTTIKSLGGKD